MRILPPVEFLSIVTVEDSSLPNGRTLTAGDHLTIADGGGGDIVTVDWRQNFRKRSILYSDMNTAADWLNFATGTGTSNVFTTTGIADGNRLGILTSGTGTTATGFAGIGSAEVTAAVFGTSVVRLTAIVQIPTLSTVTETFNVFAGFYDRRNSLTPVDGVLFNYSNGINSGKWQCECYSNSVSTTADSGVTVTTGWVALEIEVNAAASSAVFKINGSTVATISTNIPSGTARATGIGVQIIKSVGSTARNLYTDLLAVEMDCSR